MHSRALRLSTASAALGRRSARPHQCGDMHTREEPLLTAAEESLLAQEIEVGLLAAESLGTGARPAGATEAELVLLAERGEQCRRRFLRANLGLVGLVARQEADRSQLERSDLYQEGCLGLIHALERFDHRRGVRFATYALVWIRAQVRAATATRCGELNVPTSRAESLRRLRGVEMQLTQTLGRLATVADLATATGQEPDWVRSLLDTQVARSLDSAAEDGPIQVPDQHAEDSFDRVAREACPGPDLLSRLHGLEQQVVSLRYGFADGEPHTCAEIARLLALPVTRIRRAEARALESLREICPQQAIALLR